MVDKHNFQAICKLTEKVLEIPKGLMQDKSRKRPLIIARQIASVIGLKEANVHKKIIGSMLNRDRTLINYYEHQHEGNYKNWKLYRESYNKVYKAYKNIEGLKEIFTKGSDIKEYLIKKGVKEAPKNLDDIIIAVKSGEASTLIKVTELDFVKQLENIKLALKNYYYTIEIL